MARKSESDYEECIRGISNEGEGNQMNGKSPLLLYLAKELAKRQRNTIWLCCRLLL